MNTGIISSRYARALLRFARENGDAEETCRQARILEKAFSEVPEFHRVLNAGAAFPDEDKLRLIEAALGGREMAASLRRFLELLFRNGRLPLLRFMLRTYVDACLASRNIHIAQLELPRKSPRLEAKLSQIVKARSGMDLVIETALKPEMIGGFVFRIGDFRIDTSIDTQLRNLKRQFQQKNRRIV